MKSIELILFGHNTFTRNILAIYPIYLAIYFPKPNSDTQGGTGSITDGVEIHYLVTTDVYTKFNNNQFIRNDYC